MGNNRRYIEHEREREKKKKRLWNIEIPENKVGMNTNRVSLFVRNIVLFVRKEEGNGKRKL